MKVNNPISPKNLLLNEFKDRYKLAKKVGWFSETSCELPLLKEYKTHQNINNVSVYIRCCDESWLYIGNGKSYIDIEESYESIKSNISTYYL